MENQSKEHYNDIETQDFADEFQCCVCLDIMYKPVVLACGHISCFWCVFKAMDSFQESHCTVCRNPYNHFPSICKLLHFLLLKLFPSAYKIRERQVAEEEKKYGYTSPQFDNFLDSHSNKEFDDWDTSPHFRAATISNSTQSGDSWVIQDSSKRIFPDEDHMTMIASTSSYESTTSMAKQGNTMVKSKVTNEIFKHALRADLQCAMCKQLLCRPVVLNCGHVYCEACIYDQDNKVCRCPVCQSAHPNGFPNVCLVIDHFLEEHFPEEYSARKASLPKQLRANPSGNTTGAWEQGVECLSLPTNAYTLWRSGHGPKVHLGVLCDCCGMFPIIGERYKCKDCVEKIGFDLCEGCYNSSSKLPGRFNQQHTQQHQFVVAEPANVRNIYLSLQVQRPVEYVIANPNNLEGLTASNLSHDASQDDLVSSSDSGFPSYLTNTPQDLDDSITFPISFNDPPADQEGSDSRT